MFNVPDLLFLQNIEVVLLFKLTFPQVRVRFRFFFLFLRRFKVL